MDTYSTTHVQSLRRAIASVDGLSRLCVASRSNSVTRHWTALRRHFGNVDASVSDKSVSRAPVGSLSGAVGEFVNDVQTTLTNVKFNGVTVVRMNDDRCFKMNHNEGSINIVIPLTSERAEMDFSTSRYFPLELTSSAVVSADTNCIFITGIPKFTDAIDIYATRSFYSKSIDFHVIVIDGYFISGNAYPSVGTTRNHFDRRTRKRALIEIVTDSIRSHSSKEEEGKADTDCSSVPVKKRPRIL